MTKLMDLTLKELKVKAVKAGFPEDVAETFKTKAQVVAVIESLKAKVKLVDQSKSAEETSVEKRTADKAWLSKREKMGKILESQTKVGMMIQLEVGEKPGIVDSRVVNGIREFKHISGSVKTKIINGYKWILPKGVMTMVPQQVYDLLSNELTVMANLGSQQSVDRIDPKTNRPVRDALS